MTVASMLQRRCAAAFPAAAVRTAAVRSASAPHLSFLAGPLLTGPLLSALLFAAGVNLPPTPAYAAAADLDRIVAVVNDEVVTARELAARERQAEQQLAQRHIPMPAPDVLRRQVLERLIVDRAQLQMAKENGVRVDDTTVNAAIQRIAEQNQITVPALREKLEQEKTTFSEFREDIRDEIMLARLHEREVDSHIQISEGEIDNFLAEQAGKTDARAEYDIAQILLRLPENASPDQIDELHHRADDLRQRAADGTDFAQLAASFSSGAEALKGGDLGWRAADRLPAVFVDAVKDLKQGEVAKTVRSPGGFHVLKLLGRRGAGAVTDIASGPLQQTHVRHILLRVTDATPEPEVARRLADLRDRITKGGQDFAQLARLHSVDPSSTRGGDLGWLYPGDTVPEFERAMNGLKINEVSEPVHTPFGWHLIQVLERRTEQDSSEHARLSARQALRERKSDEATLEWLRQLRDRTYVEYRDE
jgi:peptidyl-prolyl cis-trans isomerase SurA